MSRTSTGCHFVTPQIVASSSALRPSSLRVTSDGGSGWFDRTFDNSRFIVKSRLSTSRLVPRIPSTLETLGTRGNTKELRPGKANEQKSTFDKQKTWIPYVKTRKHKNYKSDAANVLFHNISFRRGRFRIGKRGPSDQNLPRVIMPRVNKFPPSL